MRVFLLAASGLTAAMILTAAAQDVPLPGGSPSPAQIPEVAPTPEIPSPAAPGTGSLSPNVTVAESKFIDQQRDTQLLATSVIGATVFNASDEGVGSIKDILIDADRQVIGVVIGFGGFLGIGEKTVAVSMNAVEQAQDENGGVKFLLALAAEELDAAPAFMTLEQQRQEELQALPPGPNGAIPGPAPSSSPSL